MIELTGEKKLLFMRQEHGLWVEVYNRLTEKYQICNLYKLKYSSTRIVEWHYESSQLGGVSTH